MWLFYNFNFERNYEVLKSKRPCILLNKNVNFNKNETQSKMESLTHSFRETKLVLQNKNRKLRVKLWWVGARERIKRAYFAPFISFEGTFLNICVLSQCIVYWIHFQNIHIFTYQKTYFIHFCCLLLKSSKAFSVSCSV